MTATWRLRRCRLLEKDAADFSTEQKSIDRARAQSHSILRRSMTELRKLQTERTIREQLDALDVPGLTDTKQVLTALAIHHKQRLDDRKADATDSLEWPHGPSRQKPRNAVAGDFVLSAGANRSGEFVL